MTSSADRTKQWITRNRNEVSKLVNASLHHSIVLFTWTYDDESLEAVSCAL